jgi:hypothetical protein
MPKKALETIGNESTKHVAVGNPVGCVLPSVTKNAILKKI